MLSNDVITTSILAPEILGNRNIKSRIRRFDWLLESLESSVVIGCLRTTSRVLLKTDLEIVWKIFSNIVCIAIAS